MSLEYNEESLVGMQLGGRTAGAGWGRHARWGDRARSGALGRSRTRSDAVGRADSGRTRPGRRRGHRTTDQMQLWRADSADAPPANSSSTTTTYNKNLQKKQKTNRRLKRTETPTLTSKINIQVYEGDDLNFFLKTTFGLFSAH